MQKQDSDAIAAVDKAAHPLLSARGDYDPLIERAGEATLALLGEASHGTHEFYKERAEITKRLIKEKGFTAVAVEADWPDAYRVNRYARGSGPGQFRRGSTGRLPAVPGLDVAQHRCRLFCGVATRTQ